MRTLTTLLIASIGIMVGIVFLRSRERRKGTWNRYMEGTVWYNGVIAGSGSVALCAFAARYLFHLEQSTADNVLTILLLLAAGVLGFFRKSFRESLFRKTLNELNNEYSQTLQCTAKLLEPYRWTKVSVFNAGYEHATNHG